MNKFLVWFERNRKPIGYTVGALNVFSGVVGVLTGNIINGVIFLILGSAIILDTKMFK